MPRLEKPHRSEKTIAQYHKRVVSLLKKAKKELEIPNYYNMDLKQFVGWLCADKNNLAYTSWKQYKSALVSFIELSDDIEENLKIEVLDLLKEIQPEVFNKKTGNTSSEKLKKFPLKDFMAIVSYLDGNFDNKKISKSEYYKNLKVWLFAGILTGLRPTEWAEAQYVTENGKEKLIVKNAKNSNGRAHGDTRTIYLDSLTKEEREYIKEHLNFSHYYQEIGKFAQYQKACADLLRRVGRIVLNKRKQYPSLYSLRHQFAADAKSSGLSKIEIGALMGHATDDTASISYARKVTGHSLCRVKADPQEVLRIKQVYDKNKGLEKTINNKLEKEKNLMDNLRNSFK